MSIRQHPGPRYCRHTVMCIAVSTCGRPISIGGGATTFPVLQCKLRNLLIDRTLIPVYSWISEACSP
jgi:hypothetical protein